MSPQFIVLITTVALSVIVWRIVFLLRVVHDENLERLVLIVIDGIAAIILLAIMRYQFS